MEDFLVSDALKDNIGNSELTESLLNATTYALIDRCVNGKSSVLSGILEAFVVTVEGVELELSVEVNEAFNVLKDGVNNVAVKCIEIHRNEAIIPFYNTLKVNAVRVQDLDALKQTCTLVLSLK